MKESIQYRISCTGAVPNPTKAQSNIWYIVTAHKDPRVSHSHKIQRQMLQGSVPNPMNVSLNLLDLVSKAQGDGVGSLCE
jgi:hypothetical protein